MNLDCDDDDPRGVPPDQREVIPMHDKVGDAIEWYPDVDKNTVMRGEIVAVSQKISIARNKSGIYYAFLHDSCQIKKLTDRDRCETCGEFICACQNEQQTEEINKMEPVLFSELEKYKDGQKIDCVEGKLTKIWEAKSGTISKGPNKGKPWALQGFTMEDSEGNEMEGTFAHQDIVQDLSIKGSTVRITAKVTPRGQLGLKIKEDVYNKKVTTKIWVEEDATIEILDGSQAKSEPKSETQKTTPVPARTQNKPSSRAQSASEGEYEPPVNLSPVEGRIKDYFDVLEKVEGEYAVRKANGTLNLDLAPGELKDIATGMVMSYKAKYGTHGSVLFGSRESNVVTGDFQPSQSTDAGPNTPTEKEVVQTWKDVVTESGKRLGDYDLAGFIKLAAWAWRKDTSTLGDEIKRVHAAILIGAAEKKLTILGVFNSSMMAHGLDDTFKQDTLNEVLHDRYNASVQKLTHENVVDALKNMKDIAATAVKVQAGKSKSAGGDEDSDDIPL